METRALLESLSNTFGVSGFEDDVRDVIRPLATAFADEVRTDVLGNLIATRRGRSPRTLMIDAHMDEIGFIVNHVEDSGFLRFATIGGWDARVLPAQAVTIRTRDGALARGVIGTLPPHLLSADERAKPSPRGVAVHRHRRRVRRRRWPSGASASATRRRWRIRSRRCPDGCVLGKALDDRVGCTVMLQVLRRVGGPTRRSSPSPATSRCARRSACAARAPPRIRSTP